MCSKAILALLVYGIIMHCSVYCSPAAGLQYPALRLEDEIYDEDGNTLQDFAYDHEPLGIANPSSVIGEMYTLYYPPEKRHADGIFNKAYRKLLGQLSARKYLHSLMAKRVGGASGGLGDETEPLTKRHIDGIFTDSYSRYRKQMAVKKYLAAVLGKSNAAANPPRPSARAGGEGGHVGTCFLPAHHTNLRGVFPKTQKEPRIQDVGKKPLPPKKNYKPTTSRR
ncbi:pituitary adenylate cyclase-activating polypeptide isoform X1 [Cuculus canorus]|uniref:pituitary adenylate cyclase-activating polypeptide isoform X1 n=1 Tax=Cuculus canorus TaxID=55661 RepID=UPI0023AA3992|nr:pituitary adenylate cyclase-activating polypeptide isoform X1 [Cuculus canorus]XP_053916703.1 pituitary adenylate cyclase-activating polypeptide isoform X1 [Cuculus canorus]